jgi:hypothetical protein
MGTKRDTTAELTLSPPSAWLHFERPSHLCVSKHDNENKNKNEVVRENKLFFLWVCNPATTTERRVCVCMPHCTQDRDTHRDERTSANVSPPTAFHPPDLCFLSLSLSSFAKTRERTLAHIPREKRVQLKSTM